MPNLLQRLLARVRGEPIEDEDTDKDDFRVSTPPGTSLLTQGLARDYARENRPSRGTIRYRDPADAQMLEIDPSTQVRAFDQTPDGSGNYSGGPSYTSLGELMKKYGGNTLPTADYRTDTGGWESLRGVQIKDGKILRSDPGAWKTWTPDTPQRVSISPSDMAAIVAKTNLERERQARADEMAAERERADRENARLEREHQLRLSEKSALTPLEAFQLKEAEAEAGVRAAERGSKLSELATAQAGKAAARERFMKAKEAGDFQGQFPGVFSNTEFSETVLPLFQTVLSDYVERPDITTVDELRSAVASDPRIQSLVMDLSSQAQSMVANGVTPNEAGRIRSINQILSSIGGSPITYLPQDMDDLASKVATGPLVGGLLADLNKLKYQSPEGRSRIGKALDYYPFWQPVKRISEYVSRTGEGDIQSENAAAVRNAIVRARQIRQQVEKMGGDMEVMAPELAQRLGTSPPNGVPFQQWQDLLTQILSGNQEAENIARSLYKER